eukprot:2181370-Prymnesium_polylepis.1
MCKRACASMRVALGGDGAERRSELPLCYYTSFLLGATSAGHCLTEPGGVPTRPHWREAAAGAAWERRRERERVRERGASWAHMARTWRKLRETDAAVSQETLGSHIVLWCRVHARVH